MHTTILGVKERVYKHCGSLVEDVTLILKSNGQTIAILDDDRKMVRRFLLALLRTRVAACLALPCLALPCLVLSCLVWSCLVEIGLIQIRLKFCGRKIIKVSAGIEGSAGITY